MLTWPTILKPVSGGYASFVRSLSGGQSLSGFEQVQPQLHDRWMAGFGFRVRNAAQRLLWRGFLASMRGRANTVLLPAYGEGSIAKPLSATANASAALNATVIDLLLAAGASPQAGQYFSIGTRMHVIERNEQIAGALYRLTIWPWLRADLAAGTALNFATPACEMRFATDQEGAEALSSLELLRSANFSLRFDEAAAT